MNESQDEKYKDSIAHVCEKINTLRMSHSCKNDADYNEDECNTFVYKGDSDEELEAQGTILNNSLLKQYTEQLNTFVFKGEGILNKESDSKEGSSGKDANNEPEPDTVDSDEDELVNRTLLKQYSQTLEEDEDDDNDTEDEGHFSDKIMNELEKNDYEVDDSGVAEDNFDETIVNVSKYQYKGLKDTFALRRDRNWKKHSSDSRDLFQPVDEKSSPSISVKRHDSDSGVKSPPKSKTLSLSASFSGSSSMVGSHKKISDPRLNQSLRSDDGQQKVKSKMRTCDRIEQSAKIRETADRKSRTTTSASRPKSPKKAFIQIDPKISDDYTEEPVLNVNDVISHLRKNITPFSSVDSHSEVISPQESEDVHARVGNFLFSNMNVLISENTLLI